MVLVEDGVLEVGGGAVECGRDGLRRGDLGEGEGAAEAGPELFDELRVGGFVEGDADAVELAVGGGDAAEVDAGGDGAGVDDIGFDGRVDIDGEGVKEGAGFDLEAEGLEAGRAWR